MDQGSCAHDFLLLFDSTRLRARDIHVIPCTARYLTNQEFVVLLRCHCFFNFNFTSSVVRLQTVCTVCGGEGLPLLDGEIVCLGRRELDAEADSQT